MHQPMPSQSSASHAQPFDPALAAFRTRVLPVDRVVDLLDLSHAPDRIEAYREAMRRGDRFPPISVVLLAGHVIVADGHKRFAAYCELDRPDILVELWPWRRLLADQGRQVRDNARKNWRILTSLRGDPRQAGRLLQSTLAHWLRVARSLGRRTFGR